MPAPLIHPVILCGGIGTRLWPLSRRSFPKQFSKLIGQQSLFQAAVLRTRDERFAPPLVVTADDFRFIVTEQLAAIETPTADILIEPDGRNTAPALLAAALWAIRTDPDAIILASPSDHAISDGTALREAAINALPAVEAGQLVTFGIYPSRPEIGYGYLELAPGADTATNRPQNLKAFIEKPDAARAQDMVESGNFLWNSGIFLFKAKVLIEAFHVHEPALLSSVAASVAQSRPDLGFVRLAPEPWAEVQSISIDYAIMEKVDNIVVMPFTHGWSDLGSWESVWQESQPDTQGNVISSHATAIECTGSLLRSEMGGLELVGIGLEDMIAVAMPDAVLVAKRTDSQRVSQAVTALKARQSKQATSFPREHRPWGWFESLALGDRFQVKRIVVHPDGALSLQNHMHRSEHWIVVEGTAKITIDDQTKLISENQSVYIPLGAIHRLENPGKLPLTLIEVQTGSYLGEDDIIRYQDNYSRD